MRPETSPSGLRARCTLCEQGRCAPPPRLCHRDPAVSALALCGLCVRYASQNRPLCFHNLTNPFSRNSLPLIIIQIGRGVAPLARQRSEPILEPLAPKSTFTNHLDPYRAALALTRSNSPLCRSAARHPRSRVGTARNLPPAGRRRLQTRRWLVLKANGRIIPPQPCRKVAKESFLWHSHSWLCDGSKRLCRIPPPKCFAKAGAIGIVGRGFKPRHSRA
jgi:hypothetical protein